MAALTEADLAALEARWPAVQPDVVRALLAEIRRLRAAAAEGGLYRCTGAEVEMPSLKPVAALEREGGRGGLALSGPDAAGVALGALYRLRLEEVSGGG